MPVRTSQIRTVLVFEDVTTRLPSGLNCAERTQPACFIGSVRASPVRAFQIRAVSSDAVTILSPSRLNCAEMTKPSCFIGSVRALPVSASQTCAELSDDCVTIRLPSGLNCAELTRPDVSSVRLKVCSFQHPKPGRCYALIRSRTVCHWG